MGQYGYSNGWIYMHKCKLNNEKLTQWKNCGKNQMLQTQKRLTGWVRIDFLGSYFITTAPLVSWTCQSGHQN